MAVREAALQVMLALADMMLEAKQGTIGEFMALGKLALVQAAFARARAAGERTPRYLDIQVETGISRNDIPELLRTKTAKPPEFRRWQGKAERVLSGWWTDPRYSNRFGRPAVLDMDSFQDLVKRHSDGTKRAAPILKELMRSGAVQPLKDGRLKVIKPTCVNVHWDPQNVRRVGLEVRRHLEALVRNLKGADSEPLFVRSIESTALDPFSAGVLLKELRDNADVLVEGARETLTRRKKMTASEDPTGKRIWLAVQLLAEPAQVVPNTARAASGKVKPAGMRATGKRNTRSQRGVGAT
jgi:hypothetical protein